MTDSQAGNAAFRWATIFLQSLQQYGVQHVVLSPGSRSTPLTLAAASNDQLQKHIILDERSAAFTALGIGKATNRPAVLICTSGTAVTNYYPAVVEARQSGVPMILATADRPPHLRATGANQAIDQHNIFGDYPVLFHDVGEPRLGDKDLNRLSMLGQQAVHISQEKRGPVHLNFPFRKPLEPEKKIFENDNPTPSNHNSPKRSANSFSITLSKDLKNDISLSERPLIIVGPLAPDDNTTCITQIADRIRAPILSESAIDHDNTIRWFSGFLRNENLRAELNPDLILRFGFQPTSKSLESGLTNWSPDNHYHFASTGQWQDATFSGAERVAWMGNAIKIDEIESKSHPDWIKKWKTFEKKFGRHVDQSFKQEPKLTDGAIYYTFTSQIPPDHFISVSNSFPARDIHLFGKQSARLPLFQNRGASGIDGITSTAIGLSLGLDRPGILFTGDLAFLHDTNALLNHNKLEQSLTVIVINNAGGNIFRMLPIKEYEEHFTTYFETPQSVNIQQLTGAYDIPYLGIDDLSGLQNVDLQQWSKKHSGLSVIECQTDADASMKLRKKLWNF
jgi:2-succinyl-5-enolpyruvyl-6-hydroxy-3-cyclohexene-1-carboxylate synthase